MHPAIKDFLKFCSEQSGEINNSTWETCCVGEYVKSTMTNTYVTEGAYYFDKLSDFLCTFRKYAGDIFDEENKTINCGYASILGLNPQYAGAFSPIVQLYCMLNYGQFQTYGLLNEWVKRRIEVEERHEVGLVIDDKWQTFDIHEIGKAWQAAKAAGLVTMDCELNQFVHLDEFERIMHFWAIARKVNVKVEA